MSTSKQLKRRYEDAVDTDDVMRVATDAIAALQAAEAAGKAKPTDKQLAALVKAIVSENDYDQGKALDKRYAEEPETVDERVAALVAVARKHVEGWK